MKEIIKEENVIILDFLPNGYPFDTRPLHMKTPIAQAIGKEHLILLELVPKKGVYLQPHQEVYIGSGKREEIHHIIGRIPPSKLTETAKSELNYVIEELVKRNEKQFVDFFNNAVPINMRRHQLELLPGIGKKHMWEIIEKRGEKKFESFEDIKNRVKLMPNPKKTVIRRIMLELEGEEKINLFIKD